MKLWIGLILIALLMILQYQLWVGDGSLGHRAELQRQIEEQQIRNQQLEVRNEVITQEIEILTSGDEAIEEVARSRLGMIGEDETFYLIPEPRDPEPRDNEPKDE